MTDLKVTDQYLARLLMVSFFLPAKLQVVAVMLASVYFIIRSLISRQPISRADYLNAFFIASLYLLYLGAIPLTEPAYRGGVLILCSRKASLLIAPFLFAISGTYFRNVMLGQRMYFVYACLLSCLAANAGFIYHYYLAHSAAHGLSHVVYRIDFESFTGIHPTYMGMYLAFSIGMVLLSQDLMAGMSRTIRFILFYVLLVCLLSLLAKSAIIALAIMLLHFAYIKRWRLMAFKWHLVAMGVATALACYFVPFIAQRSAEVMSFLGIGAHSTILDNSMYVRKMIVDVDTRLLKANWLTGVGPGRLLHLLKERYFFYSINHNSNVSFYDPHSEYMYEWLSFGIAGIAVLVTVLMAHVRRALTAHNTLYLYCLIILITTFFTESVLARQQGVLFYSVFTSLFFFSSGAEKPKVE